MSLCRTLASLLLLGGICLFAGSGSKWIGEGYEKLDPYAVYPGQIGIDKREANLSSNGENILLQRLENALSKYENIAFDGGWPVIPDNFPILKTGDLHDAVPAIRSRLCVTGDYNCSLDANRTFDRELADAVRRFQLRHALKADGIVGPDTLEAMNVPVQKRVETIKINIVRLRWLTTGSHDFIAANIPTFTLALYRDNRCVLSMKTVVGRKERATPMISDTLTYAVLNPYWRAPKTIVAEDILPKLKAGRFDYLESIGIVVTQRADGNDSIDMRSIDWHRYDNADIPYIFLQKPGEKNYLGFVKFMFPNEFDVYIHDTPDDYLFRYDNRAKSSGCIRVEKPIELFHALYENGTGVWRYKRIVEELLKKEEKLVGLPRPLPIYILYMTAFVDEAGEIHFVKDIYGYDRRMVEYMNGD
ncbi:L,D-transpeptidase family protein [Hydrogenimonas cancrithermarum]|uniref:L,D-TPase catalytic domain-containing protein n=1 Tax=Hydrogenimonas cancrithermarum TaxID=2993563 RepID=A0ABM8FKG3_9BACT|nr:L,D-transpeptidase family protein [Hydrogenimonas cancrithermarum]BDY11864.1 hypothetical protein HCR_01760 [Hydrogenimonas cancrithermarum]